MIAIAILVGLFLVSTRVFGDRRKKVGGFEVVITQGGRLITRAEVSRGLSRIQKFMPIIEKMAERFNIDPEVIVGVVFLESRGIPGAVGDGGKSIGLMQVGEEAWEEVLLTFDFPNRIDFPKDLFDPKNNIFVGSAYLRINLDRFGGMIDALRAYNCGPTKAKTNERCGLDYAQNVAVISRLA